MSEDRLWERTEERIEEGRDRRKAYKDMLRQFVGEGGVRLTKSEKRQLFRVARENPELRMAIVQAEQERFKMKPSQIPKSLIADLQRLMEAD